jgi:hypothetical protein
VRLLTLALTIALVVTATLIWQAPDHPTAPRSAAPQAKATVKDCRDLCEQRAIVEQLGDEYLRRCRLRCEGRDDKPRPYEPIRRITVAPADHHRAPLPPYKPTTHQ